MRKAMVLGTVLATTGMTAGLVAMSAQASPSEPGAAPATEPATQTATPTATESAVAGRPATPGSAAGTAGTGGGDGAAGAAKPRGSAVSTVTASAVMVTPPLPKRATYAYGKHARQKIDAYWRPRKGGKPRPAVLVLHGGSWLKGDKRTWKGSAIELTNRGYVAFAANYRFANQARWPAQRNDVVAAVRFIKRNARKFGVDPDRVVVLGSSAGGHLATMLGVYGTGSQQVRGVVALSPVTSPYLAFTDGGKPGASSAQVRVRDAVGILIGCTPAPEDAECWPKVEDAAVATHASAGDAPMLLVHSQNDFVPATHATGLRDALAKFNVRVTVKVVPGDAHAVEIVDDPRHFDTVVRWIDQITKP